jgi:hypothetical protein
MKSVILASCLGLSACLAHGQGTVNFNNKFSPAEIDAPISYAAGSPFGGQDGVRIEGAVHSSARAALYGGPDGSTADQLVLVAPAVGFRFGIAAGYINVGDNAQRSVPGVSLGGFAIVQVRAWDAADGTIAPSYELASQIPGAYLGASGLLRIKSGGDTPPGSPLPNFPGDLIGLEAFTIDQVPEPGSICLLSLGIVCAASLKFRKREKL